MLNPFGGGGGDSFSSGGIGNSKSQQSNLTETTDASVVGAEGSINTSSRLSVDGNNNIVTTTDYGAVSQSLALAKAGIEGAQKLASQSQGDANDLLAGVFSENAKNTDNLTQAVVDLKTSDVRTLVIAGMAVVGLVAIQLFRKKA